MTIRLSQKPLPQLGWYTRHGENPADLLHQKSTEPSLILTVKVGLVRVISPDLRGRPKGPLNLARAVALPK
jgi:hypothetical protein